MKLNKETNFITAEELLVEVRNQLKKFYQQQAIDDSYMYPVIRNSLAKLGAKVYPVGSHVVHVYNKEGKLPTDFHKLILAVGCFSYTVEALPNENPQLYDVSEAQIEDFFVSQPSTVCVDDCGASINIIQRFETFEVSYTDYSMLSVSKNSFPYCVNNCFNKKVLGQSQIEINGNRLLAGFEEGFVYIDYLQKLEKNVDDGKDLIIPDFPRITEWIVGACVTEGLKIMYINGTENVQQRLQYMEQKTAILETNARSFIKANDFSEFYNVRRVFYGRFDKFNQMIYGNPNISINYR